MEDPRNEGENLEFDIIELEERLEFGVALVDSDLDGDTNSACSNGLGCSAVNTASCGNSQSCS